MTIIIKAGAGLVAGVVAGALGLAFFPRVEPDALKPRVAVEKPRFVVAAASSTPLPVVTAGAAEAAGPPTPAPPSATPSASPSRAAEAATPAAPANATPTPAPAAAGKSEPPKAAASAPAQPTPAVASLTVAKAQPSPSPASVEVRAVAPAPRASVAAEPSEAAARWSVQGLIALAKGDLSSARAFLTRAAEAGDARAWVALADTYDPATLSKFGVVGAPGDAQRAKDCLIKAAAAGIVVKDRMAALDQDPQSLR